MVKKLPNAIVLMMEVMCHIQIIKKQPRRSVHELKINHNRI